MKPYASIETVYTRDAESKLLHFGELRAQETSEVARWVLTEKIDGMNIRIICTFDGYDIRGRTDRADVPGDLKAWILDMLPVHDDLVRYFTRLRGKELSESWSVTFYGEGYGPGIQRVGSLYAPEKRFRAFDVLLGESLWTGHLQCTRICRELGIPQVPFIAVSTIIPVTSRGDCRKAGSAAT